MWLVIAEEEKDKGGRTLGLVCQAESVGFVGGLQGANIVVFGTLQDLG